MEGESIRIVLLHFKSIDVLIPLIINPMESGSDLRRIKKLPRNQPEPETIHASNGEPDCKSTSNTRDPVDETSIIGSFFEYYGCEGARNIFDSIHQYPSEHMLKLLHSYQYELEKTKKKTHRCILQNEIKKLEHQIDAREEYHRDILIKIFLKSTGNDDMEIQKKYIKEHFPMNLLIKIILEIEEKDEIIQELEALDNIIEENSNIENECLVDIFTKRAKEIRWAYVDDLFMKFKTCRDRCKICFNGPKEYIVLNCGHYALCIQCKNSIEQGNQKTCPICRGKISNIRKVYE